MSKRRLVWFSLTVGAVALAVVSSLFFRNGVDWLTGIGRLKVRKAEAQVLRKLVQHVAEERQDFLRARFPEGYVLFAADGKGNLVTGTAGFTESLGIDWDQLRVVQITKGSVSLIPPGVYFGDDSCIRIGKIVTFGKGQTERIRLCRFDGQRLDLALVSRQAGGIVCCLGMSRE